jgi:hypothetical protein
LYQVSTGPVPQLIQGWKGARRAPLDLGLVRSSLGTSGFLERVGTGLVPAAVAAVKAHADDEGNASASRLGRAVSRYYEVLLTLTPSHTVMTLDEQQLEGDYLMVEVLNTSVDRAEPCALRRRQSLRRVPVGRGDRRGWSAPARRVPSLPHEPWRMRRWVSGAAGATHRRLGLERNAHRRRGASMVDAGANIDSR